MNNKRFMPIFIGIIISMLLPLFYLPDFEYNMVPTIFMVITLYMGSIYTVGLCALSLIVWVLILKNCFEAIGKLVRQSEDANTYAIKKLYRILVYSILLYVFRVQGSTIENRGMAYPGIGWCALIILCAVGICLGKKEMKNLQFAKIDVTKYIISIGILLMMGLPLFHINGSVLGEESFKGYVSLGYYSGWIILLPMNFFYMIKAIFMVTAFPATASELLWILVLFITLVIQIRTTLSFPSGVSKNTRLLYKVAVPMMNIIGSYMLMQTGEGVSTNMSATMFLYGFWVLNVVYAGVILASGYVSLKKESQNIESKNTSAAKGETFQYKNWTHTPK